MYKKNEDNWSETEIYLHSTYLYSIIIPSDGSDDLIIGDYKGILIVDSKTK